LSFAGTADTAILVTSFPTVAVYFVVLPLKDGDKVPGEILSDFKELSAESVPLLVELPDEVLPVVLPDDELPVELPDEVLPVVFPDEVLPVAFPVVVFPVVVLPTVVLAALLTVTEVLLPDMEASSSFVSKTTPSDAAKDIFDVPADTAFNVTVKLSVEAVTVLPPPPYVAEQLTNCNTLES
jgi:hypothetical protein